MSVKILHAADFHMDSAFDALPPEKAAERRAEQRQLLERLSDLCQSEQVDLVLLAGDLFDSASSYFETHEALLHMLSGIRAEVFIAPGNHDYYSGSSPYAFLPFPENVHIFTKPSITHIDLPALGVRVYGAGYGGTACPPLLSSFRAEEGNLLNLMVLHGNLEREGSYAPFTEADIASSGLDYLALGHVHTYSGILSAGCTRYAYPGCIEGRGFDETGKKGVILGSIGKDACDLHFVPLGGREYEVVPVDLTGAEDMTRTVLDEAVKHDRRNICRFLLTGRCGTRPDVPSLLGLLQPLFYSVSLRDKTRPGQSLWDGAGENSLRGLFLEKMKQEYDSAASEEEKQMLLQAVQYGLAALDGREEW